MEFGISEIVNEVLDNDVMGQCTIAAGMYVAGIT
jgi:hypothetical protein